jgi:DNA-binding MarR family transcriptional regulator
MEVFHASSVNCVLPESLMSQVQSRSAAKPAGQVTVEEIRDRFGYLLRRGLQTMRANIENAFIGYHDLTSTQHAILTVLDDRGSLDQAAIARILDYDKTNIGIAIRGLLAREFVVRTRSNEDKRRNMICLSKRGRAAMPEIQKRARTAHDTLTSRLTKAEQEELKRLLRKLTGS